MLFMSCTGLRMRRGRLLKGEGMKISEEDVALFYRLNWSLLFYTNQKYPVIMDLKEPVLTQRDSEQVFKLQNKLYSHPELIDSFVAENPFKFNEEEIGIIKGWKNFVKGKFLIVAYLKDYTIFLTTDKDQKAYGVLGLFDEIEDVLPPLMPIFVDAILLPFKGKIIYSSIINSYNIQIGGNMRRGIQKEYQKAKSKYGIIASLDAPVIEKKESDEELLRYYTKSFPNRFEHSQEIDKILKKNPALWSVYHKEFGKWWARKLAKRLSEIGAAPAWFALFEDTVIASEQSEEEAKARADALLPEEKKAGVYLFRWKGIK